MNTSGTPKRFGALAWLSLAFFSPAAILAAGDAPLADSGYEDTEEGIAALLGDLHRDEAEEKKIDALIVRLDDDAFAVRQEATIALTKLPALPRERLRGIATSANAEVRARIGQALRVNTAEKTERLLAVAAKVVSERGYSHFGRHVIPALASVESSHRTVWTYARRALLGTVEAADVDRLRELLAAESALGRACAIDALEQTVGAASLPDLLPRLEDPDERVRLEAALTVRRLGGRECLPVLVQLLEGAHPRTRYRSVTALRELTGKEFQFRANDLPEKRAEKAMLWKQWLEQNGATSTLNFKGNTDAS